MATIKEVDLLLKVGGVWNSVELETSVKILLNIHIKDINNPSVNKGEYTYDVKIPKTGNNIALFKNVGHYDSVNSFPILRKADYMLYVKGSVFRTGYFRLDREDSRYYYIVLYSGVKEFFTLLNSVKLRDANPKAINNTDLFGHIINKELVWSMQQSTGGNFTKSYIDINGIEQNIPLLIYGLTYQGAYDDFDAQKVITGTNKAEDVQWVSPVTGKEYKNPELDEHRRNTTLNGAVYCGDYRSYYQKPFLRFKTLFDLCLKIARGYDGYRTNLDPTFFNDNNPYWNDTWVSLDNLNIENGVNDSNNKPIVGQTQSPPLKQDEGTSTVDLTQTISNISVTAGKSYTITYRLVYKITGEFDWSPVMEEITKKGMLFFQPTIIIGQAVPENYYLETVFLSKENLKSQVVNTRYPPNIITYLSQNGEYFIVEGIKTITPNNTASVASLLTTLGGNTYWTRKKTSTDAAYNAVSNIDLSTSYINIAESSQTGLRSNTEILFPS
jgi:hypothetical protein